METTLNLSSNLKKEAIKNGLIWAVINIAIFLIVFYVKPDFMASFTWMLLQIAIGIGLAICFCFILRKATGGFWTFKNALSNIFLMFFIQAIVVFLFTLLFAKIEPAYVEKMKAITSQSASNMLEKIGTDQELIDEKLAEYEIAMEKQFNPGIGDLILGIGTVAIMYFIAALIFAAIFKRDPPFFAQAEVE